jgi:hypothetical protein
MLLCAAGEKAPPVPLGTDAADRRKAHEAWQAWWDGRGGKLDLPAPGPGGLRSHPSRLARNTADRFLRAILLAPSLAEFRRTTDVPFVVQGDNKVFKTRAELDAMFAKDLKDGPTEGIKRLRVTVRHILRPQEYAQRLPANDQGEREFLRGLRGERILVALVELRLPMRGSETMPLYIRVRGTDARVIAVGRESRGD